MPPLPKPGQKPPIIQVPIQYPKNHPNHRQRALSAVFDSATRHPVFFTERLKKAPPGVGAGNGDWEAVARGYVWNGGDLRGGGGVKL
jgi:hypothetical protein